MLKVLHIYKTANPLSYGGVETIIENLSAKLKEQDVQSDILCIGEKNSIEKYDNKTIYTFKKTFELSSCPFSLSLLVNFKKIIKKYDILHYHYPWPFADLLHLLFARNKKSIVTYHSDIVKQKFLMKLYSPIEKFFLKSVNLIVATSPQYAENSKNLEKFKNKAEVIPLGIKALKIEDETPIDFSIPDKFFCFIGVLRYYKGLHLAIRALQGTSHKLLIIGDGPEGEKLIILAKKLAVDSQVSFLGKLPEGQKIHILKKSSGLILPSHLRSEAFGTVLLEAASLGKPLISCKIGTGTEFVNISGETGCCVAPDPKDLRKAMDIVSKGEFNKLAGANAKKRFEKLFTIDIMAKKYLKLYKKLCSLPY